MKLEICHADTCLSDYWSGHYRAHVSIPVWHGMTLKQIKESLAYEVRQGAIAGSERLAYLLSSDFVSPEEEKEADKAVKAAYAAIRRIKPAVKGKRKFFTDLEKDIDDDCESVYAYFVFMPLD